MSVSKIQIGQLWKKDGTGDTYLVTRLYSEALSTIVILRKSGAEDEALIRLDLKETLDELGYEVVGEAGDGEVQVADGWTYRHVADSAAVMRPTSVTHPKIPPWALIMRRPTS